MALPDIAERIPLLGGVIAGERDQAARKEYLNQLRELAKQYDALQGDPAFTQLQTGPSAYEGIQADPRAVQAQLDALKYLESVRDARGLTAEDKALLLNVQDQQTETNRGLQDAIMQQNAMRGTTGSGQELLSQLVGNQGAAARAARQGMDAAAQAQRRALEANLGASTLGSNIRQQSFGEQAQKAAARDQLAQFNKQMLDRMYQNKLGYTNARYGAQAGVAGQQYANTQAAREQAAAQRAALAQAAVMAATMGAGAPAAAAPALATAQKSSGADEYLNSALAQGPSKRELSQFEDDVINGRA